MRRKDFVRKASKTFPVARKRLHLLSGEVLYGEFEYLHDFSKVDWATQDNGSALISVFSRERTEEENLACHDGLKHLLHERGLLFREMYGMYQQVPCDAEAHDFDSGLVHEDLLLCHVPCNPDRILDYGTFSDWMLEIVTQKQERAALLLVHPDARSAIFRDHETITNYDLMHIDTVGSLALFVEAWMQGAADADNAFRWAIRKPASTNDALLMQKRGIM